MENQWSRMMLYTKGIKKGILFNHKKGYNGKKNMENNRKQFILKIP